MPPNRFMQAALAFASVPIAEYTDSDLERQLIVLDSVCFPAIEVLAEHAAINTETGYQASEGRGDEGVT